jgi:hypothetical protein
LYCLFTIIVAFLQVPRSFNFSLSGASSRSCKYVLNTLMQTFQIKRLADAVREQTVNNLITELLLWLLDERVSLMDDGSQLLKALNVLMLKILVYFISFNLFCFPFWPSRGCCHNTLVLVPLKPLWLGILW